MMDKAKLINFDLPLEFIIFDMNPSKISITKQVAQAQTGSAQATTTFAMPGVTDPVFVKSQPITLQLTNLYMNGALCKHWSDMMLSWMMPNGSFLQQAIKGAEALASGGRVNQVTNTPLLLFQWGPPVLGFVMKCRLVNLTLNFTRFSPLGTPTRLQIASMSLLEVFDQGLFALTNPTSGGKPGRAAHTVTDGETLQYLSKRHYGQPQYWRALADANGVDDPLRVRAGDHLYLPSTDEAVAAGPSGR